MKTVTRTLLFATLSLSVLRTAAFAEPQTELAKILDMFAVREADVYTVHIIADGDISEFSSALEQRESFYKLTLDVPALPPLDTEYEVETPFSRRFQVWPMQLEKKLYSRVEIELDMDASAVVGALNASHLFIRIQREGAVVASAPEADAVSTTAESRAHHSRAHHSRAHHSRAHHRSPSQEPITGAHHTGAHHTGAHHTGARRTAAPRTGPRTCTAHRGRSTDAGAAIFRGFGRRDGRLARNRARCERQRTLLQSFSQTRR